MKRSFRPRGSQLAEQVETQPVDHDLGTRLGGGGNEVSEVMALDLAAYAVLMGIAVPFADAALGRVTVSTPSLNAAVTLAPSTAPGSRNERAKAP